MRQKFDLPLKIICLLLAFALGFLSFKVFDKHKNKTLPDVQNTQVAQYHGQLLTSKELTVVRPYIGYVTPIHEAVIQPYISGFIEKIYVQGGQNVKKGDVLVVIKQDEYITALRAAYANTLKAEAGFQNAATYYERLKKAGKSVSAAELESAEASYLSAAATFEQAKADYQLAEVNYDYTIIKAPIDGVVGNVFLTPGNYISPAGPALFTIMQYSPVRVVFSISDKEYLKELEKNTPFENETLFLELPNGKVFKNAGVFRYTDNSIDKTTTSVSVYADFENIGKTLTPNTYVTVLSHNAFKDAVEIKKNLVILQNSGNFVYLVRQGKLIKTEVEILATVGENFVLKNTFQTGDALVTDSVNEQDLGKPAEIITSKEHA